MDNPLRINVINRTDTEDFKQLCELIKKFTIDTFIRNKTENSKLKGNKNKELVEKSIREFEGLEDLSVLSSKDIEKLNAGIKNQIESAKNLIEKNQLNISGKGDDVLWNQAAILDNFVSPWNTAKKSEIIFKALWDREHLFFNFTVFDTEIHIEKKDASVESIGN